MSRRIERIARSLQVHLAELINFHLNDPRVEGMVTVTAVEVSPDLAHARVGITELNADEARLRTLQRALTHASGRLRVMLTDRLEMRTVPQLTFYVDVKAIRTRETLEAIARAMQNTRPAPAASIDDAPTEEGARSEQPGELPVGPEDTPPDAPAPRPPDAEENSQS